MKQVLIVTLLSFTLGACSIFGKQDLPKVSPPVQIINSTSYPVMGNISYPPALNLQTPMWDVPRDQDADLVPKRITRCLKVPKEERVDGYWADCGEKPIIGGSNIYRGYDYSQWILFLENTARLRQQFKLYNERIDEVNRQREEWRELNRQERARVRQEQADAKEKNNQ